MVGPQMVGSYRAHMGRPGPMHHTKPFQKLPFFFKQKKSPCTNQPCINRPSVSTRAIIVILNALSSESAIASLLLVVNPHDNGEETMVAQKLMAKIGRNEMIFVEGDYTY